MGLYWVPEAPQRWHDQNIPSPKHQTLRLPLPPSDGSSGMFLGMGRRHGNLFITWCGIGYCVHQISLAFRAYAGQTSYASLGLELFANISFVWSLSIAVSGLSIALYLKERRLHRRTIRMLTDRKRELELKLDPTRTSSQLTQEGLTGKGDE